MLKWITKPVAGFLFYDFANSAFATTVLAVIFNRYFAEVIAGGTTGTMVNLPWGSVNFPGAAIWNFVVAASMAVVALTSPLVGAMADRAGWRRRLLTIYCIAGVACTCALAPMGRGDLLFASLLFIGANLGFSGGNVFYNSFLPDLGTPQTYGRISGAAWGFGYLGGGLCLVLNLIMLQKPELLGFPAGYFGVGSCVFVAGIWWGLFAIPTMIWLKDKQAPIQHISLWQKTREGWAEVSQTLRHVRRYKHLFRFLIAYLIFNDGIETTIVTASIFGSEVVGLDTKELVGFFILIQGTAFIGSIIFGWLADRIGNKTSLMLSLAIWLGVVVWAYNLGWWIGMKEEYYIIGVITGLVMGGSQSAARSLQALFTPKKHSAEFFGFFSLSGRFANVFGTAIYGTAIVLTGGVKPAILTLGLFFLVGGLLLYFVNEHEGERAATAV